MSKRKTANTVILWVVSIGLLVSMVIAFTPTLGLGRNQNIQPETLMTVNGTEISELDFARARNRSPLGSITQGEVGEDIQTLIFEQLINQELFASEAEKIRVSNGEVRAALQEFREENSVAGRANEMAYLNLIRREGFTDESFRAYLRENERRTKFTESLLEGVEATDEQVRAYFASNSDNYLTEPKIVGREIVVEDEALAKELRLRLDNSEENFAALANEYSIEKAEQGGALAGTNEEILPVESVALPTVVAEAAFALQDGGLTDVIDSGGLYYIVQVLLYVEPEPRPFEEVESDVRDVVQNLVEGAVLERKIEELRANADVVLADDSPYAYTNEPVATVGDRDILRVDLANAVYNNPSIQSFLSPQSVDMVSFFKPQILNQLIDNELAYQGASTLDADFFGTRGHIAREALHYVSKDVTVSEEEVEQYYLDNPQSYTDPAEATGAQQFIAAGRDSAEALQLALIDGDVLVDDTLSETAAQYQASVQNLGKIATTDLPYNLQAPVFGVDNKGISSELTALPNSTLGVSPIVPLSADESNFTFVIADVVPESLRPFARVRSAAEESVLDNKKQEARDNWLEELRADIDVVDLSSDTAADNILPDLNVTASQEPSFTTQPLPEGMSLEGAAPASVDVAPATEDAAPATEDAAPASESTDTEIDEASTSEPSSAVSSDASNTTITTTPDGSVSTSTTDTSTLEITTSEEVTPEEATSEEATPEEATPEEATLEEAAPEEAAPEEATSEEVITEPDTETPATESAPSSMDSSSTGSVVHDATTTSSTPAITPIAPIAPLTIEQEAIEQEAIEQEDMSSDAISTITNQISGAVDEVVDTVDTVTTEAQDAADIVSDAVNEVLQSEEDSTTTSVTIETTTETESSETDATSDNP